MLAEDINEDNLSEEERAELSGYNNEEESESVEKLIDERYLLDSELEKRELAQNGLVRGVFVFGLMLIPLLILLGFYNLTKPKERYVSVKSETPPSGEENLSDDELSRLKAELALKDQKSSLEAKPVTKEPVPTVNEIEPPPSHTVVRERPEPRAYRQPQPPPPRLATPTTSPIAVTPKITPKPVAPDRLWQQLASRGQSSATVATLSQGSLPSGVSPNSLESATESEPSPKVPRRVSEPKPASQNSSIPRVKLSSAQSTDSQDPESSLGRTGILNRRPLDKVESFQQEEVMVAIGTKTSGVVKMPLIWSEDGNSPTKGRFIIELTDNLYGANEEVAFPSGTVFIANTLTVSPQNSLVQAEVIAILSQDADGQPKEQEIPPGAISILGRNNTPLIADNYRGGNIASQEILVGVLSSLGRVGKIINLPEQEITQSTGSVFGTTTIKSNRRKRPDLVAAALSGFFEPLSERMGERSQRALEELLSRPNIAVVPEGTQVSIVINSFLSLSR
jgi:hypothetical protein